MKVVVTTDGSERSLDVLPHAAAFARANGHDLVLLRILDPRQDGKGEFALKLEDALDRIREQWASELTAKLQTAGITGEVCIGERQHREDVRDSILREATELDAVLLAMHSSGAGGAIRHALFGSVAMGVLSKTPLPVMTAGKELRSDVADPYHLVIAVDGSPASQASIACLAPALAPSTKVTLLAIYEPRVGDDGDETEMTKLDRILRDAAAALPAGNEEVVIRSIPQLGGVDSAVIEAARELDADAIAAATHGHSARYHLVAGSTALGIVSRSQVPVILSRSSK